MCDPNPLKILIDTIVSGTAGESGARLSVTSIKVKFKALLSFEIMSDRKVLVSERKGRIARRRARQRAQPYPRSRGRGRKKNNNMLVSAPVASGRVRVSQKPKMVTQRNGDCSVVHREYITDIKASGDGSFRVLPFAVNPGQSVTFPWLSRVAANYESYKFKRLDFLYETEAPTSTPGTVILTVDYDAEDQPPADKTQAMSYRSSVRSPPWAPCAHRSLSEDLNKAKSNYVRVGAQPNGTDIRQYDIGNLFVMTMGQPADQVAGELFVEYEVLLMTPIFENAAANGVAGGKFLSSGTTSNDNPFGDGAIHSGADTVGFTMTADSKVLVKQPGVYVASIVYGGTGINDILCTPLDFTVNTLNLAFINNGAHDLAISIFRITAVAPGVISFDNTGQSTTITDAVVYFAQAPVGSIF